MNDSSQLRQWLVFFELSGNDVYTYEEPDFWGFHKSLNCTLPINLSFY